MSETPITERQQYWPDHIRAAEDFDGSIADYARSEGLKPRSCTPAKVSWHADPITRGLIRLPADRRL